MFAVLSFILFWSAGRELLASLDGLRLKLFRSSCMIAMERGTKAGDSPMDRGRLFLSLSNFPKTKAFKLEAIDGVNDWDSLLLVIGQVKRVR
jgi:hypothetical protein